MLPNPFLRSIPPPDETDPDANRKLLTALGGTELGNAYAEIIAGKKGGTGRAGTPARSEATLLAAAQAAIDSQDHLLAAANHELTKNFFISELPRQYSQEITTLSALRLLETTEKGTGITAIDKKFYTVPTQQQIKDYFTSPEKASYIAEKLEQGFTNLLIVPFGYSTESLANKQKELILKHHQAKKLLDRQGNKLDLNINEPLYLWDSLKTDTTGGVVYYPTSFDKETHGGITKQELLTPTTPHALSKSPFPGFHVLLIKLDLKIPRAGDATTTGGRSDLEAGQTPNNYLALLQDPESPYHNELGLTPEDSMTLFMRTLHTTNTAMDDYENPDTKDSLNYHLAAYVPASVNVPGSGWSRTPRRASVYRRNPRRSNEDYGARVAVG